MSDDDPRPGRPGAARALIPVRAGPVEPRPDGREDDGKEGVGDGDADERDQQAGDPDAAERGHRQREQRQQRDRDGRAAEDDSGAGVPHRIADGGLVCDLSAPALLAPADDDEEGVVDRDPEPDERDEELDDHGDVGDVRDRPDEQERGRDGDGGHQQRHDRHERAEDEDEDEQGAERAEQCLDEHPGAARVALGRSCTKRVHPGDLDRRAGDRDALERRLRLLRLGLSGVDAADGGVVDERERGAAVLGDEGAVVGGGVGSDPYVRHRLLHPRKRRGELGGDARRVHGRALWKRDDGNERSDVAAAAVDLRDVLVGLVALAAGNVELLRE